MDFDCLVIGGGPAGLTAAIYLARFHLSLAVVDAGQSRAAWIPITHNHAGFPEGISGIDLLERMRTQAGLYGVTVTGGEVSALRAIDGGFEVAWGEKRVRARTVLLATGTCNRRPDIDPRLHRDAVARGLLRYCPICDGYEVTDKSLGVIGTGVRGLAEARFLRGFTEAVTLLAPKGAHQLEPEQLEESIALGLELVDGPARVDRLTKDGIVIVTPGGSHEFDSVYPALGSDCRSDLAIQVGAKLSDEGDVVVDRHQRTSVAGLYAAGDVVSGLDQISHAMGEGGVAATTIRNDLYSQRPLLRERPVPSGGRTC
jgi:thioredoxin reductase (NADPH)